MMKDPGIIEKVKTALAGSSYDAIIAVGVDNVQYLSGVMLPFLPYRPDQHLIVVWPARGEPACVCPAMYASSLRTLGWVSRVLTCGSDGGRPDAVSEVVAGVLQETVQPGATIGIDAGRTSSLLYDSLARELAGLHLVPCDDWLRQLRMVKTAAELELLERVAYRTDHGINGMLHHIIVTKPKTQITMAEEIRVHCMERDLDEIGYHSAAQAAAGAMAQRFWPVCPTNGFNYGFSGTQLPEPGEMVRLTMRASRHGYWSDAARVLVNGQPMPEQAADYARLVALREAALATLKPGVRCNAVYQAVLETARGAGIEVVPGLSLGHGVGVTPYEPPFLNGEDDTVLQAGMTLVLAPIVCLKNDQMMQSNDTVVITEAGCKVVGWWKDWREPYVPIEAI